MKLNIRLETVLNLLDKDLITADIGCDHGYLSIEFAKISNANIYAIDNKNGPLDLCKQNVSSFGFSGSLNQELLEKLQVYDNDVVLNIFEANKTVSTNTNIKYTNKIYYVF